MTDIARITPDLLNLFRDGQGIGTITEQDVRDLIKSFDITARQNALSAKDAPYNCKGDLSADDTLGLQALMDDSIHSNALLGVNRPAFLPFGNYKITANLRLKNIILHMFGAGRFESVIHYEGVAGGCIVSDAILYNNLNFHEFGIIGDNASGKAIDLSATTSQTYNSSFTEMNIIAGQQAMHIPNCFSSTFNSVFASSFNNHTFHVLCGPSVSWHNCYAGTTGVGKAGYRLTGGIRLYGCNALNSGDYWGIFGNDTTASDGFQNDFISTSYPDVVLEGCNIEAYNVTGIYLQAPFIQCRISGGAFVRALVGTYHSHLRVARGSNGTGNFVELDNVRVLNTGGASTASPFYSDAADYLVVKGAMSLLGGITGMYCVTFAAIRPAINILAVNDVFGDTALSLNALQSGRVTALGQLNIGGAGGIAGANGAAANSSAKFTKLATGIANGVATTVLTAIIRNVATSALLRVTLLGSLGAGGAIGANEANASVSYDIAISRTVGLNAVAAIAAAVNGASAVVAGGATITVTATLGAIVGAAGANNSVAVQVTITRGSGASTNHTCEILAEIINQTVQGVTIS